MQLRQVCWRPSAGHVAQPERGAERVARAGVVACDLARGAQPLVDLGGDRRQLALERERKPSWIVAMPSSKRRP